MIKNYARVLAAILVKCSNWPHVLYAKIFDKKIDSIVLRNGVAIFLGDKIGKADLSMFSEIFYKEYYNPKGFEINNGDTVFDIGANSGFFSYFAGQKNTAGKIYTFEPVPLLAQKISKNVSINNLKNIQVENLAVGKDNAEPIPFYISKKHNGCHSLYEREGETEKILVRIVGLKTYCNKNNISKINFLKLDCEGAEYDILTLNDIEFISNVVEKISMEYHDNINEHRHEEIVKLLTEHDFTVELRDGYLYAQNMRFQN